MEDQSRQDVGEQTAESKYVCPAILAMGLMCLEMEENPKRR